MSDAAPTRMNVSRMPSCAPSCCANLAIAHTGSSTLTELLRPYSKLTHHLHQISASRLAERGARCFLATVRDPASRLRSAFTFEATHINWKHSMHLWSGTRHTRTPSAFVQAMRNASDSSHESVWSIYNHSNKTIDQLDWGKFGHDALRGGNPGLIPQVSYIAEAWKTGFPVQLLCTNKMTQDWLAWLSNSFSFDRQHNGTEIAEKVHKNSGKEISAFSLTSGDAEFIRSILFPEDTRLAQAICGSEAFSR